MEGIPWDPGPSTMEEMRVWKLIDNFVTKRPECDIPHCKRLRHEHPERTSRWFRMLSVPNPSERLIRMINTNSDGPVAVAGEIFTFLQKCFPHVPEEELKEQACKVAHSKRNICEEIVQKLNQRNKKLKVQAWKVAHSEEDIWLKIVRELNQRNENEEPNANLLDETMEERPVAGKIFTSLQDQFPHVMEGVPWDPGPSVMEDMPSDPGTLMPSVSIDKTSHPNPAWRAIYKLEFGAKPEKRNRKEWICSLECKKKNQVITFKDAQATEKHIMREHPDPMYNKFVCLKDGCKKEKASPQQILDHLGQKEEKGGHRITTKIEKDENLRAVKSTGEKYRVLRDKDDFAWYICVPNQPSPPDSRSPSRTVPNLSEASLNSLSETPKLHLSSVRTSSNTALQVSKNANTCSSKQSMPETSSFAAISPGLAGQTPNCQTSEVLLSEHFSALPG